MKQGQIKVGKVYGVKVGEKVVPVEIVRENPHGGWDGFNIKTRRSVRIRSAQRCRFEVEKVNGVWRSSLGIAVEEKPRTRSQHNAARTKAKVVEISERSKQPEQSAAEATIAKLKGRPEPLKFATSMMFVRAVREWEDGRKVSPVAEEDLIREHNGAIAARRRDLNITSLTKGGGESTMPGTQTKKADKPKAAKPESKNGRKPKIETAEQFGSLLTEMQALANKFEATSPTAKKAREQAAYELRKMASTAYYFGDRLLKQARS